VSQAPIPVRDYVFFRDGVPVVTGSYEAAGDTLRLRGEGGLPWVVCAEAGEPGVYAWRVKGDRLILEDIDDSCARRQGELTLAPLTAGFPVGAGRYEVIWVEQPDGSWKIARMGD
jgi:hypothetical protein